MTRACDEENHKPIDSRFAGLFLIYHLPDHDPANCISPGTGPEGFAVVVCPGP